MQEVAIKIGVGFFAYIVIRMTTKTIGYKLEQIAPNNLIFLWLSEIGSDIRNLGKALAWSSFLIIPTSITWHFERLALKALYLYLILMLCIFAIVFLNSFETWKTQHLPEQISQKDRQFFLTIIPLLTNTGKYGIYAIGIFGAFSVLGVDIVPVLGGIGLIALVVGFGAQNMISDLVAGMFIFFERLFYAESEIEILNGKNTKFDEKISGKVIKITWRITYLVEHDTNYVIAINNSQINILRIIKK